MAAAGSTHHPPGQNLTTPAASMAPRLEATSLMWSSARALHGRAAGRGGVEQGQVGARPPCDGGRKRGQAHPGAWGCAPDRGSRPSCGCLHAGALPCLPTLKPLLCLPTLRGKGSCRPSMETSSHAIESDWPLRALHRKKSASLAALPPAMMPNIRGPKSSTGCSPAGQGRAPERAGWQLDALPGLGTPRPRLDARPERRACMAVGFQTIRHPRHRCPPTSCAWPAAHL